MTPPKETPIPINCHDPCPYYTEIKTVRQWQSAGIDELLVVSKRRDRWMIALIGGLLVCLLGLSASAIWGGITLATSVGELRGATLERVAHLERDVAENEQGGRAAADGQTTMLVTLGRITEQLTAIDSRLQRVESVQTEGNQRRRR